MAELDVGPAVYIHGLAEAIGEMRRLVLDRLRTDDTARCEDLLQIMDEVYAVLVTVDYPDAVTRGLRRTTDVMRGVIERTRGRCHDGAAAGESGASIEGDRRQDTDGLIARQASLYAWPLCTTASSELRSPASTTYPLG